MAGRWRREETATSSRRTSLHLPPPYLFVSGTLLVRTKKNVFADQKKAMSPTHRACDPYARNNKPGCHSVGPGKSRNPALLWGLCTDPFPRLFPGYPTRSSPCSNRRRYMMPCSEILRQVIGPLSQISDKLKFPMKTSKLRLHQRSESLSRRQVPY